MLERGSEGRPPCGKGWLVRRGQERSTQEDEPEELTKDGDFTPLCFAFFFPLPPKPAEPKLVSKAEKVAFIEGVGRSPGEREAKGQAWREGRNWGDQDTAESLRFQPVLKWGCFHR